MIENMDRFFTNAIMLKAESRFGSGHFDCRLKTGKRLFL